MFNGLFESYQYTVMCVIFTIALLFIGNRTTSTQYKQEIDKHFIVMVALAMLFILQDGVWGALAYGKYHPENGNVKVIWTYIWYLSMSLAGFVWTDYVIEFLGKNYKRKDIIFFSRIILVIPQIVMILINPWTGIIFEYNSNNELIQKATRLVILGMQCVFFLTGVIFSSIQMITTKSQAERRQCLASSLFCITPLIGGLLMMFDNTIPFLSGSVFISILILYIFNLNDMREESLADKYDEQIKLRSESLEIVKTLSNDYISVYYIDLESEDMTIYRADEGIESLFGEILYKKVNYSKVLAYYIDKMVLNSDRDSIMPFANVDFLKKSMMEQDSLTKSYRVGTEIDFMYYQLRIVVASRDEQGVPTSIILGVQNIDDVLHKEKDLQSKLEEAKELADAASEAKTSFLFNMSHDIRTPMNAIMGFTDMARKHIDEKEKVSDCLTKVKASSEHLLSLINDVLDMSRIESGKVSVEEQVCDINKEMTNMINILNVTAKQKDITIKYKEEIEHKVLIMDALHVERIMMNIVSNSIKYTNAGGWVEIIVKENPSVKPGYFPFVITIEDNGMGMSKEYVKHIFEAFTREKNSTVSHIQGTGLGMAITKNLVEILDGKIEVESEKDVGTKTTLEFVFKEAEDELQTESGKHKKKINLKKKKVLLVEDNALNREIAKDILMEEGLIIEEAVDGVEAVKMVTSKDSKYYDFVLMDIQMPNMDGYSATQVIRAFEDGKYKDVPIIAMTANAFEEDKKKALDMGMNAHIAKPIVIDKLLETLQSFV